MYKEADTSMRYAIALVAIAVAMAIAPALLLELSSDAALEALAGREVAIGGSWLPIRLLGQPTDLAPAAPWLLAIVGKVLDGDLGVRLCAIFVVAVWGLLTAVVARSRMPAYCGLISAAALLTCVAGSRLPAEAVGELTFALLINAAWYVWFEFGRERKSWLFAWSLAYLLVGMALLTGGVQALLYFYWPMLFLRRPIKVWLRIRQWDHWVGFLALVGFAALWTLLMPQGAAGLSAQLQALLPDASASIYWRRLIALPFIAAAGFFPWVFLVWPAFCAAFRHLEPRPVFCAYLRTIVVSTGLLVWLVPFAGPEALLPLLGPLAILVSRNYAIMVRRHGRQLQHFSRLLAVAAVGGAGAMFAVVLIFWSGLGEALVGRALPGAALGTMLAVGSAGLCLAIWLYRSKGKRPIWMSVTVGMAALHLTLFAAIAVPTRSHFTASYYRDAGQVLTFGVPETARIFWLPPNNRDPQLGWYLDRSVTSAVTDELPPDEGLIYVLGGQRAPVSALWRWRPASDSIVLGGHSLRMWRGESKDDEQP